MNKVIVSSLKEKYKIYILQFYFIKISLVQKNKIEKKIVLVTTYITVRLTYFLLYLSSAHYESFFCNISK